MPWCRGYIEVETQPALCLHKPFTLELLYLHIPPPPQGGGVPLSISHGTGWIMPTCFIWVKELIYISAEAFHYLVFKDQGIHFRKYSGCNGSLQRTWDWAKSLVTKGLSPKSSCVNDKFLCEAFPPSLAISRALVSPSVDSPSPLVILIRHLQTNHYVQYAQKAVNALTSLKTGSALNFI